MELLYLDGENLVLDDFISVTRKNKKVKLTKESEQKILKAADLVSRYVREGRVEYGITTGFGEFSKVLVSKDQAHQLQKNLIMSHACGVGEPLPEDVTRGVMLLRVNALAGGYSGTRLETVNTLIDMINNGVHPIIPEKGSLGSSGDLAPLSHVVLVMLGMGEAIYKGERMPGKDAMEKAGIKTIELTSKEGLALINGTQVMTSIGAHVIYDAKKLYKMSNIALALTMEALNGITDAYEPATHLIRKQAGQIEAAREVLKLLEGSEMVSKQGELRVQDAYSLRCAPQVHGAALDSFNYAHEKVEIEMNAVTDNPIILVDEDRVISGGNFHGEPVAMVFDYLKVGISELANISERRCERLVNPQLNNGLPAFLIENGGLNSGFMIVQYAAAALVSENKVLAHPASVDSIPSSANQEDHVSMGTIAARQAGEILKNATKAIALEILCACQAIDLRGKKKLGKGTEAAYEAVRKKVPYRDKDGNMNDIITSIIKMAEANEITEAVKKVFK